VEGFDDLDREPLNVVENALSDRAKLRRRFSCGVARAVPSPKSHRRVSCDALSLTSARYLLRSVNGAGDLLERRHQLARCSFETARILH
jgi:hypothetical protein